MGSNSSGRSETLVPLAQRLRLHNPNRSSNVSDDYDKDSRILDPEGSKPRRAAVLVCLFEDEKGELRVILTKRSSKLSSHSGEVALPGGKREDADVDDVQTALRESKEEIGLDPSLVEVVTVLDSFTTKNDITVIPVIGILWDKTSFNPVLNASEVESIFDVPLEMFLKDENRRQVEKEVADYTYSLHFFDYKAENESYVIWAFTAGVLIQTASIVYQRPPAFEERRPKFWGRSRQ